MGGYLTKKEQIHHGRLEMFMHEVRADVALFELPMEAVAVLYNGEHRSSREESQRGVRFSGVCCHCMWRAFHVD